MAWAAFYANHQMEAATAASAAQALLERIAVEQQVELPVMSFCQQAGKTLPSNGWIPDIGFQQLPCPAAHRSTVLSLTGCLACLVTATHAETPSETPPTCHRDRPDVMTTRARSWCMTLCSFFSGPARPQLGSSQVETRLQLVLAVLLIGIVHQPMLRPPPAAIETVCPGRQQQLLSIRPPPCGTSWDGYVP